MERKSGTGGSNFVLEHRFQTNNLFLKTYYHSVITSAIGITGFFAHGGSGLFKFRKTFIFFSLLFHILGPYKNPRPGVNPPSPLVGPVNMHAIHRRAHFQSKFQLLIVIFQYNNIYCRLCTSNYNLLKGRIQRRYKVSVICLETYNCFKINKS